jgi:serine/threonine-protein kinase
VVGRYAMFDVIASGGMATVHYGRLLGPAGFSRTVAIKRLHAQYAGDPELAEMFLDEARVAARIRHANVVTVIDVVAEGGEIFLVMEYVHGESLAYLLRADAGGRGPRRLALVGNVMASALQGLHAAHEATGENNRPLEVVHRDFSPQNILVGVDGTARVLDFGVAKAAGQTHHTDAGKVKGKIRYLSPEQVTCGDVDRRTDLWAASVVLWEALTGKRLFSGDHDAGVLLQVLQRHIPSPREIAPDVPEAVAQVVMRGLERDRKRRFSTALEMATALEEAVGLLPARDVGAWVERLARGRLDERRRTLDDIESVTLSGREAPSPEFAATTDTAMVRVSAPERDRPTFAEPAARRSRWTSPPFPRTPALAWGAAATLVVAIAGGVASQLLARTPVRVVIATAAPSPLPSAAIEAAVLPLVTAPPPPAPAEAAPPAPTASAHAPTLRPRARPALSRTRGVPVDPSRGPFSGRE